MLRATGVTIGRALPILANLTISLGPGAALVLRGRNGIGKTTLLRTLAGLQPVMAGELRISAETIAYASHADGVKTALSVRENLAFWARLYGVALDPQVLDHWHLSHLADRPAGLLSAGQKRRLGLARLDVIRPDLALLDEPTVSLDADSVGLFRRWLVDRHLGRRGAAVIATHIDLGIDAPDLVLDGHVAVNDWPDDDEVFL